VRIAAVALVAACLMAACGDGGGSAAGEVDFQKDCGFPAPKGEIDESRVPDALLMPGSEIFKMQTRQGRDVVGMVVPHDVEAAFQFYRKAAKDVGYEVLQLDNEGFEAEIYLKAGKELAAFTIRSSVCEGVVAVYLNLPVDG
jgi:hypothetical protein